MCALTIEIGDMPIVIRTDSEDFVRMLADRYGEFVVKQVSGAEFQDSGFRI